MAEYQGIAFIGDPHLASRTPGFRKDDYPRAALDALEWCLDYAQNQRLIPAILGDVFHWPRDNANWLLSEILKLFSGREIIGIHGNHDCREDSLRDDDSLKVIVTAGSFRLVDLDRPWRGRIQGRSVVVGGTNWGEPLPSRFEHEDPHELVVWLAHHDVQVPGYEEQGRFRPTEIPGIDLIVNGHIHRTLGSVQKGRTRWMTPGNISRVKRSDATREHVPSILQLSVAEHDYTATSIDVPHRPFDEEFHEVVADAVSQDEGGSAFVRGLAELQARRTESGEGLQEFLDSNLSQFEDDVAAEIRELLEEVTDDGRER